MGIALTERAISVSGPKGELTWEFPADIAVRLEGKEAEQMLRLMEALEDQDDVQNVYANFDIPDEVMAKVAG